MPLFSKTKPGETGYLSPERIDEDIRHVEADLETLKTTGTSNEVYRSLKAQIDECVTWFSALISLIF